MGLRVDRRFLGTGGKPRNIYNNEAPPVFGDSVRVDRRFLTGQRRNINTSGVTPEYIGDWRVDGVIFADLPAVWERGDDPDPFGQPDAYPLYNAGTGALYKSGAGDAEYSDGVVTFTKTAPYEGGMINTGVTLGERATLSVACWYTYDILSFQPGVNLLQTVFANVSSESGSRSFMIQYAPAGRLGVYVYENDNPTPSYHLVDSFQYWYDNDPRFIVFTFDNGVAKIYIDGVDSTGSMVETGTPPATLAPCAFPACIGASPDENEPEVRATRGARGDSQGTIVYDRALDLTEVQDLYAYGPTLNGLYGYREDDNTLTILDYIRVDGLTYDVYAPIKTEYDISSPITTEFETYGPIGG